MSYPSTQIAIVQTTNDSASGNLPLTIDHSVPVPKPPTEHHAVVQVFAVALNPNDHKMVKHFNIPGGLAGCDFSGVIAAEAADSSAATQFPVGTRVCGALFPYIPDSPYNGSFSQYCVVDSRLLVKVPESWSDLEAASLGVGWSTISLALSDPNALGLQGLPTKPTHEDKEPILVYGGATASGTFACQMLKLMGYTPIAIASNKSSELAIEYGASATASYTSKDCVNTVKAIAGKPIRRVLDCITDMESAALCYSALARTGGMYACLEDCPQAWRTRRTVKVKEVMGFQVLGVDLNLAGSTYKRPGDKALFDIGVQWASEIQSLMETRAIKPHPLRELTNGFQSIIDGLEMLAKGEVRGQKLVVRVPQAIMQA